MSFVVKGMSETKKSIRSESRYEWGVSCFIRAVIEEWVIQRLPTKEKLMM